MIVIVPRNPDLYYIVKYATTLLIFSFNNQQQLRQRTDTGPLIHIGHRNAEGQICILGICNHIFTAYVLP